MSHLTNNDLVYGDCVQSLGTVYGMDKRLVTATPQQNMRRISSPDDDDDDDGPFAMVCRRMHTSSCTSLVHVILVLLLDVDRGSLEQHHPYLYQQTRIAMVM